MSAQCFVYAAVAVDARCLAPFFSRIGVLQIATSKQKSDEDLLLVLTFYKMNQPREKVAHMQSQRT